MSQHTTEAIHHQDGNNNNTQDNVVHNSNTIVPEQQQKQIDSNDGKHNDAMDKQPTEVNKHNGDNQNNNKQELQKSNNVKEVGNNNKNNNDKTTHQLSQQQHQESQFTQNSQQGQLHQSTLSAGSPSKQYDITQAYSAYFHNNTVTPKKHILRMKHSQSQQSNSGSSSLFQAKQSHKETSVRLHILTNRINKLALEDKMITEKAEDTEAKANIIFEVKRREQIKKKESMRKKIEVDEVKFTHPIGQMEKRKVQLSRQFIIDKNKEEALALKKENNRLFQDKALQQQTNFDNIRARVEKMKKDKEIGSQMRSNFFHQKAEVVQADQMAVLEYERRQQERKEELLKQLEQKEQEQLAKLMTTKQRNKNAQEQLQFSKTQQTKEYESRFGTPQQTKVVKTINGLPASRFQNQAVVYVLKEDKQGLTVLKTKESK